ncbi:MAG: hypothetical protein PHC66_02915 [Candidatus Nanoarchaeia archaeon]|nr:hypothetical protein [Candidatus Nanoarchaeia archaeon]MDD5239012.1 hypothetical protein [Candidatus Nanoarchaeia archaeon]
MDDSLLKKLAMASKKVEASRKTPKAKLSEMRHSAREILAEYFGSPVRLTPTQYNAVTKILSDYPGLLNDEFRPNYLKFFMYPSVTSFLEKNQDNLFCTKELIKNIKLNEFSDYIVTNAMTGLSESIDSDIIAKYNGSHIKSYKLSPECAEALRFDWISHKPVCRTECESDECPKKKAERIINTRLITKKRLACECEALQESSQDEIWEYITGDKRGETNMFTLFGVAQRFLAAKDYENAIKFYEKALKSIEEVRKTKPSDEGLKHVEYEVLCKLGQSYPDMRDNKHSKKIIENAMHLEPGNAYAHLINLKRILESGEQKKMPDSKLLYFLEGDDAILTHEVFKQAKIDTAIKVFKLPGKEGAARKIYI